MIAQSRQKINRFKTISLKFCKIYYYRISANGNVLFSLSTENDLQKPLISQKNKNIISLLLILFSKCDIILKNTTDQLQKARKPL